MPLPSKPYELRFELSGFNAAITCLLFAPNRRRLLAVGDNKGCTSVIDYLSESIEDQWEGLAPVTALEWHHLATSLFVGYQDGGIAIFDVTGTSPGMQWVSLIRIFWSMVLLMICPEQAAA